jgi:hypothetical protein
VSTDEPIVTAIDQYLSHQQFRDDHHYEPIDWQERVWKTKDKLLKLQWECRDVDYDLVSWEELTTLDDLIITIGFYEISSWSYIDGYVWKVRRDKESTIPPILGQQWYHYLGERPPIKKQYGVRCSVVVLLSDEGVLFANEIARRIRVSQLKNWWW